MADPVVGLPESSGGAVLVAMKEVAVVEDEESIVVGGDLDRPLPAAAIIEPL